MAIKRIEVPSTDLTISISTEVIELFQLYCKHNKQNQKEVLGDITTMAIREYLSNHICHRQPVD